MMELSIEDKEQIAARTVTLEKCLKSPSGDQSFKDIDGDEWIETWKSKVAEDDFAAFLRRLDFSNVTIKQCRRRVHCYGQPPEPPLPNWLDTLDEIVASFGAAGPEEEELLGKDNIPFIDIFAPIVRYAFEKVQWEQNQVTVMAGAKEAFKYELLGRLHSLASHALFIHFKTFLKLHDVEPMTASTNDSREYYSKFIDYLRKGGLIDFCRNYAQLSNLLVTTIRQWVTVTKEFLARTEADWDALADKFFPDSARKIKDIAFLGDAHDEGRTVIKVTVESGKSVMYKPRDFGIDDGFYDIVDWMNRTSDLPNLYRPSFVARGGYGWMEWINRRECESDEELARYYTRSGVLLCLLYVLKFTDGHLENIIAWGDQPVVVDLETLMSPEFPSNDLTAPEVIIRDSVLGTALLPVYLTPSQMQDVGGFGVGQAKDPKAMRLTFENINTDSMEAEYEKGQTLEAENLPILDGEKIGPKSYHDEIKHGFERTYRFLSEMSDELLGGDVFIDAFGNAEGRVLLRDTRSYGLLRQFMTSSPQLHTALDYESRIELLAQPFATGELESDLWPIYEAERTALSRLDIPRFTYRIQDTQLFHDDESIVDFFEHTPLSFVRDRIESLNRADRREQLNFIDLAYAPQRISHPISETEIDSTEEVTLLDSNTLTQEACAILERIQRNVSVTPEGELVWNMRDNPSHEGAHVHHISDDLYEGRIGIALFAAAVASQCDSSLYREFVEKIVDPIIEKQANTPLEDSKVGAGHGSGSYLYGLLKVGELLNDHRYIDAAHQMARRFTPDTFKNDTAFDLVNGSAGSIVALLSIYEHTRDDDLLSLATAAGDHIIANRELFDGAPVWYTLTDEQPLTGMTHGIAGISYALFRLADEAGTGRFRSAALESLEFERQQFSSERCNWPDFRPETSSEFVPGWCNGRAGIGLSRLAMLERDPLEEFRQEIDHALRGTDPTTLQNRDHICCGNFGRVEFLAHAYHTLGEQQYRHNALQLASLAVHRSGIEGHYQIPWQTADWYNPTLFAGEAGIGYTLLRLHNPDLPCVLLWK